MIDRETAENLKYGQTLFSSLKLSSKGKPVKVRVTGKCKTWKRDMTRFRLPVKHGLYESFYIENDEFAAHWHLTEEAAIAAYPSGQVKSERYLDQRGMIQQRNWIIPVDAPNN